MHALGPIRALRPRLHRVYTASLIKPRVPPNGPRKVSRTSRDDALILSRQISIAGARSHRPHSCVGTLLGTLHTPRSTHVTMAVQPEKSASSPKRVNGGKSPKAAKAKATTRSPTDDIEDLIEKHPALNSIKDDAPVLRDELLGWYDRVHRILPWRRNPHSQHAPPPRGPGADATPAQHWAGCHETGASMDGTFILIIVWAIVLSRLFSCQQSHPTSTRTACGYPRLCRNRRRSSAWLRTGADGSTGGPTPCRYPTPRRRK